LHVLLLLPTTSNAKRATSSCSTVLRNIWMSSSHHGLAPGARRGAVATLFVLGSWLWSLTSTAPACVGAIKVARRTRTAAQGQVAERFDVGLPNAAQHISFPFMRTQNLRSLLGMGHRERPDCNCGCCTMDVTTNRCAPVYFGQTIDVHSALDCEVIAAGVSDSNQCIAPQSALFMLPGKAVDKSHFCSTNCEPSPLFAVSHKAPAPKAEAQLTQLQGAGEAEIIRAAKPPGPECVTVSEKTLDALGIDPDKGDVTNSLNLGLSSCDAYDGQVFADSGVAKDCALGTFLENDVSAMAGCTPENVCTGTGKMMQKLFPTFWDNTDCACELCHKVTNWYAKDASCANQDLVETACAPCSSPMSPAGCNAFKVQHLLQGVSELNAREQTEFRPIEMDLCIRGESDAATSMVHNGQSFCTDATKKEIGEKAVSTLANEFDANVECSCYLCVQYLTDTEQTKVAMPEPLAAKCATCVGLQTQTTRVTCEAFRKEKFTAAEAAWTNLNPGELESCVDVAFKTSAASPSGAMVGVTFGNSLMNGLCTKDFVCDALQHISDAIGAIPAGMDGQCPCFLCLELRKYLSGAGQGCHNALTVQKACQTCVPVQDPNIVTLPGM